MSDLISRQAAIDAVMEFMPSLTTPDGCGQFDREIFEAQEMFFDIGQALNKLPSAQPEIIRCKDCKHNPKETWFGCPMSHLSEKQRPETAWCWKAERSKHE